MQCFNNLVLKVTQLVSGRAGTQTQINGFYFNKNRQLVFLKGTEIVWILCYLMVASRSSCKLFFFFRWKHDQFRSAEFPQTNIKQLTHNQRSPSIHESNSLWEVAEKKKNLNSQRTARIEIVRYRIQKS